MTLRPTAPSAIRRKNEPTKSWGGVSFRQVVLPQGESARFRNAGRSDVAGLLVVLEYRGSALQAILADG